MAMINDGGNFGDDPMLRLLAKLNAGSLSEDDIKEKERLAQEGIDTGTGVAGTIRNIGSGIKLKPSAYDLEQEMYKKASENAPSFWEKFGPKPITGPSGEVIPIDKFRQIRQMFKGSQ